MSMHSGSANDELSRLAPGGRLYVETTYADVPNVMRRYNPAKARRPAALRTAVFKTELLTAVCAGNAHDVRYLVCVERMPEAAQPVQTTDPVP